jgi:RND family efflux transporter MFP subunit
MRVLRVCLFAFLVTALYAQQPVDVVKVVSRTVERKLRLPGEFRPYLSVDLFARVTGFVEKVEVDRGSLVKQGQLLVLLSAPEMAAQRAEAEAKTQAIESQRAEAQARFVAAESTYERLKVAAATPGAVAGNELIVAQKTMEAARAAVAALEDSQRAAEESAKSLDDLQSYLKVTAPFEGVITTRYVHPGTLVGPSAGPSSNPLLRLEHNAQLRLVVAVPEADVGGILTGARVPFTVQAYPGETFSGVVARIAHSVDVKTRTMPVELDVRNPNGRLAPGMYPEVSWPVRRLRPSLLVPPSSIVTTTAQTFVIRLRNGAAEWVDVVRGFPVGELVEVFGALKPGDEIVRHGSDEIREGAALQARRP